MGESIAVIVDAGVPLSLFCTFEDDRVMAEPAVTLRYGQTEEVPALIERANMSPLVSP